MSTPDKRSKPWVAGEQTRLGREGGGGGGVDEYDLMVDLYTAACVLRLHYATKKMTCTGYRLASLALAALCSCYIGTS